MIGENQLSAKNLGYEMTKNVLTILSPRFNSRGETLTGLVLISSWGGGIVLVASIISAISAVTALVGARRNAKAIQLRFGWTEGAGLFRDNWFGFRLG